MLQFIFRYHENGKRSSFLPLNHGLTSQQPASSSSDVAPVAFSTIQRRPSRRHTYDSSAPVSSPRIPFDPSPALDTQWPQWPPRTPQCHKRSSVSHLETLYLYLRRKKHKSEISFTKKSERNAPMRLKVRYDNIMP